MDSPSLSETDNVTIQVLPPDHDEFAGAFWRWAGEGADGRVFFTPGVLIAIDVPARRGYLYDDGWQVEVFVDRGVEELVALLSGEYVAEHCELVRRTADPSWQRGLLNLALEKGVPLDEVRHLL